MGFRTIFNDVTAGTAVNPATSTIPQVIKTYNLDVTDDELIAVIVQFRITTASSTHAQSINLIITVGSNTYTLPYVYIATGDEYVSAIFPCVSRAGDTINVSLGGGAGSADPLASINVYGFFVQAWSGQKGGT